MFITTNNTTILVLQGDTIYSQLFMLSNFYNKLKTALPSIALLISKKIHHTTHGRRTYALMTMHHTGQYIDITLGHMLELNTICICVYMVGCVLRSIDSEVIKRRPPPPIHCPLRRTCSSAFTPFPPGIEPRAVAWQSITLPLRHASSTHVCISKRPICISR